MALTLVSSNKHFGGMLNKYSHQSSTTQCVMVFNIFLPKESVGNKVPVLYCLGGLTSTEDNFAIKSGFGPRASQYGLALVFPDTSPRDVDVPEAGANPDIGYSAGFYLNATQHPWDKNWKMYDYIAQELPQVLAENLPVDVSRSAITGHSMGGHGALTIFLKNQDKYKSVSAFAPITHPTQSAWGKFAFPRYLGEDPQAWDEYDTINLLQRYKEQNKFRSDVKVLIDQGTGDGFLDPDRLHTSELIKVVDQLGLKDQFEIRYQDGYNHGYFFISTFMNDHVDHHAKALGLTLP
ncbi:MAG: putative esterase D [Benniella sp.]|nr:MAG: putative esterase D [Benniella sp.]